LGKALLLLGSIGISAASLEGTIAFLLRHSTVLPVGRNALGKPFVLLSMYYRHRNEWVVQYLPDCAHYDPGLTYTLRPNGTCRVINYDQDVTYSANRFGLRDSDSALDHPYAVVLGDSYAMGWGVEAAASFPKQLGQDLGKRVLNTGIASYGTVRELLLLERLRLPPFPVLVIQYCENDFRENKVYVDTGKLPILSEAGYRAIVARHLRTTGYFPFKHIYNLAEGVARELVRRARSVARQRKQHGPPQETDMTEARYFLEVLNRHLQLLEGKRVLVLELNGYQGYQRDDGKFISALRRRLRERPYAELARLVAPIDVAPDLKGTDYYRLDGHLRASGDQKVARDLAEVLQTGRAGMAHHLRGTRQ
jgi:hypothetical protein